MRASELRLRRLIDTVPATISAVDRNGRVTLINSAHRQVYGIDPASAIGRTLEQVYGEEHATRQLVLNAKVFETGETLPSFEQEVTCPISAKEHVLLTTKSPLLDDAGRVADVVTVSLDITEQRWTEAQMRHQAGHDALTGLPNRVLFSDRLTRSLARRSATAQRGGAAARPRPLQGRQRHLRPPCRRPTAEGGRRLRCCVMRETDTVARLGGDEFVVLPDRRTQPEASQSSHAS